MARHQFKGVNKIGDNLLDLYVHTFFTEIGDVFVGESIDSFLDLCLNSASFLDEIFAARQFIVEKAIFILFDYFGMPCLDSGYFGLELADLLLVPLILLLEIANLLLKQSIFFHHVVNFTLQLPIQSLQGFVFFGKVLMLSPQMSPLYLQIYGSVLQTQGAELQVLEGSGAPGMIDDAGLPGECNSVVSAWLMGCVVGIGLHRGATLGIEVFLFGLVVTLALRRQVDKLKAWTSMALSLHVSLC